MNAPYSPEMPPPLPAVRVKRRNRWFVTLCVFFGIFGLTAASAAWWYHHNFNATPFKTETLSATERDALNGKLATLGGTQVPADPSRTIVLNEREINAWIASQPGLADKVKVHLDKGLLGATVLLPVEEGAFLLGGKTIRIKVSFNTSLDSASHKLSFSLADVSVGGISVPNSWLSGAKGVNLLADNGPGSPNQEFLHQIAAGIRDFKIDNGELRLVLNE